MGGIESVFVDVAGAGRARVLVAGDGPQPLLLVHGWPTSARVFWPLLVDRDLRARFRMLAPDLFGFGRSTLAAPSLTFAHEVDAVVAVAERLAGAPCMAVGASFGARVLIQAMARAPALFQRAVLLAPYLHRGLIGRSFAARLLARFPRQVRALYRPPLSIATGLWAAFCSLIAAGDPRAWARQALPLVADVARMRPETLDLVDALPDGRPLLRELGVPVDVWYGDRDQVIHTPELAALAALAGLNVVRLDGAGHALHDSHARQLAAALLAAEQQ